MSTAAPVVSRPRLPSIAEIERSLRERLPGLTIYQPSDRWIQLDIFGLTHLWACPDLGGAVEAHPVTHEPVVCNGRTMIHGRYLTQKDSSGKIIEGQDAPAMIKLLVSPDRYGQMGFVWLPGVSAAEDQRLVDLSQSVWLDFQRQQDEAIVSKRAEFKSNWLKSPHHKGEPVPPPTRAESAAVDRLQRRKRAAEWKFDCPVPDCPGYATNEWGKFTSHMNLAHQETGLDRSKYEAGTGLEAGAVTPVATTPSPLAEESLQGGIAAAVEAAALKAGPGLEPEPEPGPGLVGDDDGGDIDRPRRRRR